MSEEEEDTEEEFDSQDECEVESASDLPDQIAPNLGPNFCQVANQVESPTQSEALNPNDSTLSPRPGTEEVFGSNREQMNQAVGKLLQNRIESNDDSIFKNAESSTLKLYPSEVQIVEIERCVSDREVAQSCEAIVFDIIIDDNGATIFDDIGATIKIIEIDDRHFEDRIPQESANGVDRTDEDVKTKNENVATAPKNVNTAQNFLTDQVIQTQIVKRSQFHNALFEKII